VLETDVGKGCRAVLGPLSAGLQRLVDGNDQLWDHARLSEDLGMADDGAERALEVVKRSERPEAAHREEHRDRVAAALAGDRHARPRPNLERGLHVALAASR